MICSKVKTLEVGLKESKCICRVHVWDRIPWLLSFWSSHIFCCPLPPATHWPGGPISHSGPRGHLCPPEPSFSSHSTSCSCKGLGMHELSLWAPWCALPGDVSFFSLDAFRHLSQALVVSLHAAANSPPSAAIPTVGSSFL